MKCERQFTDIRHSVRVIPQHTACFASGGVKSIRQISPAGAENVCMRSCLCLNRTVGDLRNLATVVLYVGEYRDNSRHL